MSIRDLFQKLFLKRPDDVSRIKTVVSRHRRAIRRVERVVSNEARQKRRVIEAIDAAAKAEQKRMLCEVPVEELNKDEKGEKRGIRIKNLRDAGYETLLSVSSAPEAALAAINGISEEGAKKIKSLATAMAKEVCARVKVRLDSDTKTEATSNLVLPLCCYRKTRLLAKDYKTFREEHGLDVEKALQTVRRATWKILWMFSSDENRTRALEAGRFLEEKLSGSYWDGITALGEQADKIEGIVTSHAWKDFEAHSASYFSLLEEINPGLFGHEDAFYGLPEDLCTEIEHVPFDSKGLKCDLRRYQEWGARYALCYQRVLLGDEMGLGKTIQAIAVMMSLKNADATHFLVVCPASVVSNWCREIAEKSSLTVHKVYGSDLTDSYAVWQEQGGVAVTSFESSAVFLEKKDRSIALLVVDEAHYVKNPEARRSKIVTAISARSERILFMTGTALENNVDEMIRLIRILNADVAEKAQAHSYLASAPYFRETIARVYYRRKREDVLTELPELTETEAWCSLSADETRLYEEAILNKDYAAARRVSWNVADLKNSSKARRMIEIVHDAAEDGRKVIVFSFYRETIQQVTKFFGSRCIGPITGSINATRRQEMVDEFNKAPAGTVLVAQIVAGGTGLNIQSASIVILCEPQVKPSIENQAISRAYRMGQTRHVFAYRLLSEDTIDERMMKLLHDKQSLFDSFADKSEAAEASLNLDDKTMKQIFEDEALRIQSKC